jgi:sugar phosphate isomerase/epimerase
MFTLRAEEAQDRMATLRAVREMGYDGVEFYGIYMDRTPAYARDVRRHLDALGLRCFSTHTRRNDFAEATFPKAIEANQNLVEQEGSRFTPLETAKRSLTILRELRGPEARKL